MYICPVCGLPLKENKKGFCCKKGHRFDTAAQGYVNLLTSSHRNPKTAGDNAMMVKARTDFLSRGYYEKLANSAADVLAVTMPCFGTTKRTRSNAEILCGELGVSFQEIRIANTVRSHFADIGQDEKVLDVTFENGQARVRTLELMDLASRTGGLVVGTGDLSELALGWATYNGDHMSMYGVNGSIPKTLVRYLVAYEADRTLGELSDVLQDVLDTPVSPELLPPKDGEISQKTEDLVGPYELHDFFLYYMLRFGYPPRKIFRAAHKTFAGVYDDATIKKWLTTFMRRFFTQQFKRSCLPDGPKVGTAFAARRLAYAVGRSVRAVAQGSGESVTEFMT